MEVICTATCKKCGEHSATFYVPHIEEISELLRQAENGELPCPRCDGPVVFVLTEEGVFRPRQEE